jgi:flagellar biosynthetic protein FliQ
VTQQLAIELCKNAIWTALLVAAPMLLVGLVIGIVVSLFQSVTQIHEMTLTFIPKILGVVIILIMTLPWLMNVLLSYTTNLFTLMTTIK